MNLDQEYIAAKQPWILGYVKMNFIVIFDYQMKD